MSILVLPNYPHSGLPKTDLEADWASFSEQTGLPEEDGELSSSDNNAQRREESLPQTLSRDRSLGVLIIATLWISFCFFSALYVCMQIDVIEEYYQDENAGWAWLVFWVFSGGVMPVVAGGGNYVRWKRYEWWILKSGKLVKGSLSDMGGGYENEEGGSYVQMS